MVETKFPVLPSAPLQHLPQLRIDTVLFEKVFVKSCSMNNCNATCCREGVLLDPIDKRRILDHAGLIRNHMDADQEHDSAKWFDGIVERDPDFPSGTCEGTAVGQRGCVFLNAQGWCVLQKAALAEGLHKWALKPFYCVAYPLTIDGSVLTTCEPEFANRPECCSTVAHGEQSVFDVCHEELEHILGGDGLKSLHHLQQQQQAS